MNWRAAKSIKSYGASPPHGSLWPGRGGEPAQAGLVHFVARGFNRRVEADAAAPFAHRATPWAAYRRRGIAATYAAGWFVALAALISCVPPAPLAPPPPPTPRPISEEAIQPVETLETAIIDLNESRSPDGKTVTVTGTLVNRGTRATREVHVHVEALDKDGAVIVSADPAPSTNRIAPDSTATFSVTFESRPDIDRYHAEAISR